MSIHKRTVFTGVATALITPFCENAIDFDALGRLIEHQISGGVSALLVAGTTGESATLSDEELYELIAFSKRTIRDRVPLLAGCGSNCTSHAVQLAEIASEGGADALLAVTPYYNKASERGLILHYETLADRAPKPLILYNVPSRTGVRMSLDVYRALAGHENIVGVKEASGDLSLLESLCAECGDRLDVYVGNDDQTVAAMKMGAVGVISVYSNVAPREMCEICRLCAANDFRAASQRQRANLTRMNALFKEVNPIPVKYVASLLSLCRAEYRLPLCAPAPDTARMLKSLFLP